RSGRCGFLTRRRACEVACRRACSKARLLPNHPAVRAWLRGACVQQDQAYRVPIGKAGGARPGIDLSDRIFRSVELQPVEVRCGPREQRILLRLGQGSGNALERIEDHLVAALSFVGWEIAL